MRRKVMHDLNTIMPISLCLGMRRKVMHDLNTIMVLDSSRWSWTLHAKFAANLLIEFDSIN
jgi:hypothetical protein